MFIFYLRYSTILVHLSMHRLVTIIFQFPRKGIEFLHSVKIFTYPRIDMIRFPSDFCFKIQLKSCEFNINTLLPAKQVLEVVQSELLHYSQDCEEVLKIPRCSGILLQHL